MNSRSAWSLTMASISSSSASPAVRRRQSSTMLRVEQVHQVGDPEPQIAPDRRHRTARDLVAPAGGLKHHPAADARRIAARHFQDFGFAAVGHRAAHARFHRAQSRHRLQAAEAAAVARGLVLDDVDVAELARAGGLAIQQAAVRHQPRADPAP